MNISKWVKQLILVTSFVTVSANAGLISGNLNVDNEFFAYISTSDNDAGTLVAQGTDWKTTYSFNNFSLVDGTNYFLHVYGKDRGYLAGFLGDFTITGTSHTFSNNLQTVLTNEKDWKVSTTGWGNYVQASFYGKNGVAPWYNNAGGNANADWIWSDTNVVNGPIDQEVYFTIAINAQSSAESAEVPEPSTLAIFALGIMGLAARRMKKQA